MRDTPRMPPSMAEPLRVAAIMPSATAMTIARIMAGSATSSVAGMYCARSW